jgi:sugar phosphate permease
VAARGGGHPQAGTGDTVRSVRAAAGRSQSIGGYRWAVLAAGTGGQAAYISLLTAPAVLAPALRHDLGLSLTQAGVVIAAPWVGPIGTLLPWGLLADRIGERRVLAAGLALCAAFTVPIAFTTSFAAVVVLLGVAGGAGASVNSASGRAVMSWFGPAERGLALGIRQTSTPVGTAVAALALPGIERSGGLEAAFLFLAALILAGAVVGGAIVRDVEGQSVVGEARRVLSDARLWTIGASAGLYLIAQVVITGFLVLYLHDERGFSTQEAALVLAAIQVLAVVLRIVLGRWSDILGDRIGPLRAVGLAAFATLAAAAAVLDASTGVVVAALVVAGGAAMSWNGLSFAAAAELAGRARSGAAIGFQQTILSATATGVPPVFAALVGATSWRAAFALVALAPLLGSAMLSGGRVAATAQGR